MCERRCYSLLPQDRISLLLASLLSGLGHLSSNFLPHVSDGESTKGRELGEGLHAHRLGRNQLDDGSISRLDELRCIFCGFTGTSVNLLQDLGELARNVGSVAIKNGRVSVRHLSGMVENDDLGPM